MQGNEKIRWINVEIKGCSKIERKRLASGYNKKLKIRKRFFIKLYKTKAAIIKREKIISIVLNGGNH